MGRGSASDRAVALWVNGIESDADPIEADLGVQHLQIDRWFDRCATAERIGSSLERLAPPLGDLVRRHVVLLGNVGNRLVAERGLKRKLGLEGRRVVAAGRPVMRSAPVAQATILAHRSSRSTIRLVQTCGPLLGRLRSDSFHKPTSVPP